MRHEWTTCVVDGYGADEVDFAARLAADPALQSEVESKILVPLVNGADGVILVIRAHADRIDSGDDHLTSLRREAASSDARRQSAEDEILRIIGRDFVSPPPQVWEDLPQIAVASIACGACFLVDEAATESAARRNRRVELAVSRFFPD